MKRADEYMELIAKGISQSEVARRFGVSRQSVRSAVKVRERGFKKVGRPPKEGRDTLEERKGDNDRQAKRGFRRRYKLDPERFKAYARRQAQLVEWMNEIIEEGESDAQDSIRA